jgi:hypothetical protein
LGDFKELIFYLLSEKISIKEEFPAQLRPIWS